MTHDKYSILNGQIWHPQKMALANIDLLFVKKLATKILHIYLQIYKINYRN